MDEVQQGGYDIRGTSEADITVEYAWNVGKALADWLSTSGQAVVIAQDGTQELARATIEGLRLQGRDVLDGGIGDKDAAKDLIEKLTLSGGAVIGHDDLQNVSTIELYEENGRLIDSESGLSSIHELVQAGNFVPAAVKGELTALA
jgi:phosphomannomutase